MIKKKLILQKMSKQNFVFKGYDFLGAPDVTGPLTTHVASLAVFTPLAQLIIIYYIYPGKKKRLIEISVNCVS